MNKRSVLITGVTSGIGNAIFNKILEKSKSLQVEQLIYLGRNEEKIDKLKYKQRENNLEMIPVVYDLEDIDNLSKKIFDIAKTIKNDLILINNAGYTEPASLLETTNSNLKKTFNVNFFAPIIITRDLLKAKIKLDKIVNIASTAGMTARPGWLSYGASKAALINASLTLYDELIQDEIYVFCISPGRCATNLRKRLAPDEDQTKIMQPEEVAKIVFELIVDENKILSGQNIVVKKYVRN